MDDDDYSSDTSDEDYIPCDGEQVSEEEESGEDEDFVAGADDECTGEVTKRSAQSSATKSKRKRKSKDSSLQPARKRKGGIRLEHDDPSSVAEPAVPTVDAADNGLAKHIELIVEAKKEEQNKKRADDLWSDFLKDVGGSKSSNGKPDTTNTQCTNSAVTKTVGSSTAVKKSEPAKPNTVKVTKEYDFAGETVTVVKEVLADSKEARLAFQPKPSTTETLSDLAPASSSSTTALSVGVKRPALGGLSSVLGRIGKKEKISVLEKSKIDWDGFKQKEGIDEELKIHNRGKGGYIERQAFLNRTDHRQFEIERRLRAGSRSSVLQPPSKP